MTRVAAAVAAFAVALDATLAAHHSHPDFIDNQRAVVEGTIEFLQYVNPHSRMEIRTGDGILFHGPSDGSVAP